MSRFINYCIKALDKRNLKNRIPDLVMRNGEIINGKPTFYVFDEDYTDEKQKI